MNSFQNPKFNQSQKQTISELTFQLHTVMPCLVLPQIVLVETGLYTRVYVLMADSLFLQLFNVDTGQPRFHQTV